MSDKELMTINGGSINISLNIYSGQIMRYFYNLGYRLGKSIRNMLNFH